MDQINGKVALVTGGGRGIGRTIALALAEAAVFVVVTGRDGAKLNETQTAITEHGGRSMSLTCDVADSASVASAFGQIRATVGSVDILVNNAGITHGGKLHQTPDDIWEQIMQTNVNGTFYCCKAALPDMIRKRWGRIVTIASLMGMVGAPFSSAYSTSKHAQLGLTRSLAPEVARYNITVNAICPGWVETDMLDEAIASLVKATGRSVEEARADLLKMSGQARPITPQEVAAEVLRLAGLEDAATTGQAITLL